MEINAQAEAALQSGNPGTLRILYHHRTLGDGAEGIHIRELVNAFRDLGHTVQVVALVGECDPTPNSDVRHSQQESRWSNLSSLLPGVIYEFAEIGYNIVGRRNIQNAIRRFKPDLIYDRYNSYSTAAVSVGRKFDIPVFVEVNAPLAYERRVYEGRRLHLSRLARRYESFICNSANHVFAVSTPLKEFLISEYTVPVQRITVLPNGADLNKFDHQVSGETIRKKFEITNKKIVGFVGILRPWHGLDMLLRVFRVIVSNMPDAHLMIVGDGPMESELKAQAKAIGLTDNVTFTGRIGHDEMSHHIAAMDIAVSPSTTFYASPMKILEYMAMGIATVAPDTPNIRDLITEDVDGKLFLNEDENALRVALQSLLENSADAKRLGENARHKVETRLCWSHVAQVVIDRATIR